LNSNTKGTILKESQTKKKNWLDGEYPFPMERDRGETRRRRRREKLLGTVVCNCPREGDAEGATFKEEKENSGVHHYGLHEDRTSCRKELGTETRWKGVSSRWKIGSKCRELGKKGGMFSGCENEREYGDSRTQQVIDRSVFLEEVRKRAKRPGGGFRVPHAMGGKQRPKMGAYS